MFFSINLSKIKDFFTSVIFGILIGASVIIPGLSGGTTAVLLGVFENILDAANSIVSATKKSIMLLLPYGIGGTVGVFLVSLPLGFIIEKHALVFSYFIIGIMLGSTPAFVQKNKVPFRKKMLYILLGTVPVILQYILSDAMKLSDRNVVFTAIVGILSAVALILPGISLTNILVMFGCYDDFIIAVNQRDIVYLAVFAAFMLIGVMLSVRLLTKLYKRFRSAVDLVLAGMILASVPQVFVGLPDVNGIAECVLFFIGGFFLSLAAVVVEK